MGRADGRSRGSETPTVVFVVVGVPGEAYGRRNGIRNERADLYSAGQSRRASEVDVHSAKELTSSSFSISVAGRPGRLADVFRGFDERDRLGVVVRRACGAVGASTLILATVTAFYDIQRERSDDFFIYPDYFLFHVGRPLGDHNMLDIWPGHKEVVVPDEPEAILRAINDRGITRLLVEDGPLGEASFERESTASARSRIVTALAYSPEGRVDDADVTIEGNAVTDSYVSAVLEQSTDVDADAREAIRSARQGLVQDGASVETYRRIRVEEALALLASEPALLASGS